ncbi:hypothetical protein VKT23_019178 [Stygiomarasmius scandens]|uniref:Uncharacterized protein n=1 Tax=Marasmiellus scandens TaxID=2682957 RepID=A0ABR1IRF8_9AGAR
MASETEQSDVHHQLELWQQEISILCSYGVPAGKLLFRHVPALSQTASQPDLDLGSLQSPNDGILALVPVGREDDRLHTPQTRRANKMFLTVEDNLCRILTELQSLHLETNLSKEDEIIYDKLDSSIVQELLRMRTAKKIQWAQQAIDNPNELPQVFTDDFFHTNAPNNGLVQAVTLSVLAQQSLFHASRRSAMVQLASHKHQENHSVKMSQKFNKLS